MESGFWSNVPQRLQTKRKSKFNGKGALSTSKAGSLEPRAILVKAWNQLPDHGACCCWILLKWPIQDGSNLRLEDIYRTGDRPEAKHLISRIPFLVPKMKKDWFTFEDLDRFYERLGERLGTSQGDKQDRCSWTEDALLFYTLQLGFVDMDFDLNAKGNEKVERGLPMFLDSISTFTFYELFTCDTFIFYTVLTTIVPLDGVSLKRKVVLTLFYLFPLCFMSNVLHISCC
ncbi:26S proteasome non-ATPase regulatory subunit 6 [Glycine soja]